MKKVLAKHSSENYQNYNKNDSSAKKSILKKSSDKKTLKNDSSAKKPIIKKSSDKMINTLNEVPDREVQHSFDLPQNPSLGISAQSSFNGLEMNSHPDNRSQILLDIGKQIMSVQECEFIVYLKIFKTIHNICLFYYRLKIECNSLDGTS